MVIALLAGGAFTAYNVLASRVDTSSTAYFPGNTLAFGSIDLVVASQHPRQLGRAEGALTQSPQLKQALCLNWQTDIQPWLGRTVSFGAFPISVPHGKVGTGTDPLGALVGYAVLAQSRNGDAARAAVSKAVACEQRQHADDSVTSNRYADFAVTNVVTREGAAIVSFATGNGWVVLAGDETALHIIVDRMQGTGDRLADSPRFQAATNALPADRYGTTYLDLGGLISLLPSGALLPGMAGGAMTASSPFVRAYSLGGGYFRWMDAGARAQLLFRQRQATGIGDLAGDTYGLASDVPGDALTYIGIGNLGQWLQTSQRVTRGDSSATNPLPELPGVPATDPALQQPAALATLKGADGPTTALLVRAPDASATQRLLDTLGRQPGQTLTPITVLGTPATALYAHDRAAAHQPVGSPHLVAVLAHVANTLVVTRSVADMQLLIATSEGNAPSLASNGTFQQLASQAPNGAALSLYVNLAGMSRLAPTSSAITNAIRAEVTALLLTQVWNDQMLKLTLDTVQPS